MKILDSIAFPLLAVALITTLAMADWKDGDNGKVSWDTDCDFPGNDIGFNKTAANMCGQACLSDPKCAYFAWSSDVCHLKYKHSHKQFFSGAVCGFVKNRTT